MASPPDELSGTVYKKSPSTLRTLMPWQKRHLTLNRGTLSWWLSSDMVVQASGQPESALGHVNLSENDISVNHTEGTTRFTLVSNGGMWKFAKMTNAGSNRVLEFDATGSQHTAEAWCSAIQAHKSWRRKLDEGPPTFGDSFVQKPIVVQAASAKPVEEELAAIPPQFEDQISVIFDACDTDKSGFLDAHEASFALSALGYSACSTPSYPTCKETEQLVTVFPLKLTEFDALARRVQPDCNSHPMLPFALRGLSLGQLRRVYETFVTRIDPICIQKCKDFNEKHHDEIDAYQKYMVEQAVASKVSIRARSEGENDEFRVISDAPRGERTGIWVDDAPVSLEIMRGCNVVVLDELTGIVQNAKSFDDSPTGALDLKPYLENVNDGDIVIVAIHLSGSSCIPDAWPVLQALGAVKAPKVKESFVLIGQKGRQKAPWWRFAAQIEGFGPVSVNTQVQKGTSKSSQFEAPPPNVLEKVPTGWLGSWCDDFNEKHRADIEAAKTFEKTVNLYTMNEMIIMPLTSADSVARSAVPQTLIEAAQIPTVPPVPVGFAQLLNPRGLDVDFFVSHWWGHEFAKTMSALEKYTMKRLKELRKAFAELVTFWICAFAINQHRAASEVGDSPQNGPFNAALSKSTYGAIMIMDDRMMPLLRLWCLYEVRRSGDFNKTLDIVTDDGGIGDADLEWTNAFLERLSSLSAMDASASVAADRNRIQYAIVDQGCRDFWPTLEMFLQALDWWKYCSVDFETQVCQLVAEPLLQTVLPLISKAEPCPQSLLKQCFLAIGMGASVSIADLELLQRRGANISAPVPIRFLWGMGGISHVLAYFGRSEVLRWLLQANAEVDQTGGPAYSPKVDGNKLLMTPLHVAAGQGHEACVLELLAARAELNMKDYRKQTPIYHAAWKGRPACLRHLIDARGSVNEADVDCCSPLQIATCGGHTDCVQLLLASVADEQGVPDI